MTLQVMKRKRNAEFMTTAYGGEIIKFEGYVNVFPHLDSVVKYARTSLPFHHARYFSLPIVHTPSWHFYQIEEENFAKKKTSPPPSKPA